MSEIDNSTSEAAEKRILDKAESLVLNEGPQSMKMDDLATALGMSKKTLYIHFPGKEAIIKAIISRIASHLSASLKKLVEDETIPFPAKLEKLHDIIASRLTRLRPSLLRDLERNYPECYQYFDQMRNRNIPLVLGTLLREGKMSGHVRAEVNPDFAALAWLHMMRGLTQSSVAEALKMNLHEILDSALLTFFRGVLTEKGQVEFDAIAKRKGMSGK